MKRGEAQFDALFRSYVSDVVAYCRWRAGSPTDAEEAVADVFLTAWRRLDDVPQGDAAREIARETGFKEGQAIRVFPFGYVAHDAAANAESLIDTAVAVGADGVIRELAVTWGMWTYTVTYRELGSTLAPVAPANAPSIRDLRHPPAQP